MDHLMMPQTRLKKLTLSNVQHSDKSFEKVVDYVTQSGQLKDLDLSWSSIRPQLMIKLLREIRENSSLESLSLGYN